MSYARFVLWGGGPGDVQIGGAVDRMIPNDDVRKYVTVEDPFALHMRQREIRPRPRTYVEALVDGVVERVTL